MSISSVTISVAIWAQVSRVCTKFRSLPCAHYVNPPYRMRISGPLTRVVARRPALLCFGAFGLYAQQQRASAPYVLHSSFDSIPTLCSPFGFEQRLDSRSIICIGSSSAGCPSARATSFQIRSLILDILETRLVPMEVIEKSSLDSFCPLVYFTESWQNTSEPGEGWLQAKEKLGAKC